MPRFDLPQRALTLILVPAVGLLAGAAVARTGPATLPATMAPAAATAWRLAQAETGTDATAGAPAAEAGIDTDHRGVASVSNDISQAAYAQVSSNRRDSERRAQIERQRRQAQSELNRNHPAEALSLANAALRETPNDARLLFLKGVALNRLQRLPEAEAVFEALIDEYPELPEPYNNLAVARAAQGKLEEARDALEAAIRTVPGYAVAHENLGDLYLQLAVRSLQRAVRLNPDNAALKGKLDRLTEDLQPATSNAPPPPSRSGSSASHR
ncbi:MAG: tetratricopeptide repeat protein [Lautropia sp.]|nr:tetratricopeptide repeat protein [Lautropia sp.]